MKNNSGNIAVIAILVLLVGTSAFAIYNATQKDDGKGLFSFPGINKSFFAPGPPPGVGFPPTGGGGRAITGGLEPPPSGRPAVASRPAATPQAGTTGAARSSSELVPLNVPEKFSGQNISPYFGRVRITSMSVSQTRNRSVFTLAVGDLLGGTVSLTGWRFQGNKNNNITLPQGYDAYSPFYDALGPIIGRAGDTIRVSTERSNFMKSVRINKCMGYLNALFNPTPKFSASCPNPIDFNDITSFTGKCQNFIRSIGSCRVPTGEEMSVFRESDRSCHEFMQGKFGYESCYRAHQSDADFFSKTWQVWLKSTDFLPFDSIHDRISFYDSEGRLAGEYVY